MYIHWREREHEDIDCFGRIPCFSCRISSMWFIEILLISTHEGTTQVTKRLGRLLAPGLRGIYPQGAVVDSND
jgi:hypothetical protein